MTPILDNIVSPRDLQDLTAGDLQTLAAEVRDLIIAVCATNGGHLAPSLGVVELTIALHRVFNSPTDRFVWDVGHQAYAHKILTGRRDRFRTLRMLDGISGFPKRSESPHDAFDVGHSSTSISAALGMAVGRDLKGGGNKVVAIIGDGSMTGGLAYEGLNNGGHLNRDLVVVLNDNEMSISENVGALSTFLSRTITTQFYRSIKREVRNFLNSLDHVGSSFLQAARHAEESLKGLFTPGMLFEAFGFEYIGPIDGHNIALLEETFEKVKRFDNAVLVHVITKKGRGYAPAEENPSLFHGVGPFDVTSGKVHKGKGGAASYTAVFGRTLQQLAAEDERVVAITAAMPDGTGLAGYAAAFPDRFIDVGIAEQHAVTFAAGLASEGFRPVVAVYSTFLQRAYDQVVHDVCIQNLPVVFALDRAGVVGSDGPTHHGVFDLSYLRHIPNLLLMAAKDENELQHLLKTALDHDGPSAIRYPRGEGVGVPLDQVLRALPLGKSEVVRVGGHGVVLAVGTMVYSSLEAAELLAARGISLTVVNARFIKPLDSQLFLSLANTARHIVTVEENALQGGFGSAVLELLKDAGLSVPLTRLGYPDRFIEQGEQQELRARYGLDAAGIAARIGKVLAAG